MAHKTIAMIQIRQITNRRYSSVPLIKRVALITKLQALQSLFPELSKQLKRKGMTLLRLRQEYHKQYPDGYRRSQFCLHFNQYVRETNPVMHLEHKAGDKMYIDFAGDKLALVNPLTGEEKKVEVFAAILGCSQLTYVEAVYSQKTEDLIEVTENVFHYFGGTTAGIVPDNLKSAVTKAVNTNRRSMRRLLTLPSITARPSSLPGPIGHGISL